MKKKKRDMKASARTLSYFLTTRGGKPTTVQQAAKALKIPGDRVSTMAGSFIKKGQLVRIHRGLYSGPLLAEALPPPKPDGDLELLDLLLKERETLDAQIEKVRSVIEMKKARSAK